VAAAPAQGEAKAAPVSLAPAEEPATAVPTEDEVKKKPQPTKRAEAKPRPVQHHVEPPRPPQPVQAQRPDPLRQLFGVFR
jgi:hypothetical protein